jgi:DNA-binding GntR family transcriptional regulator
MLDRGESNCAEVIGGLRVDKLLPVKSTPSMSDHVAATLREAITSLQLAPGSPIVEATVARQLGVSTTPVREALQRLAKEGLVVLSRHRGANVVTMTADDVAEIFQLREVLEPLAVRLAVPQLSADDIIKTEELLTQAGQAIVDQDWSSLSHCNREFHGIFIARCGNERLRSILENLQYQNRIIALLAWQNRGYQSREHDEHMDILLAVQERDPERAAASAHQHVMRFGRSIIDAWAAMEARGVTLQPD